MSGWKKLAAASAASEAANIEEVFDYGQWSEADYGSGSTVPLSFDITDTGGAVVLWSTNNSSNNDWGIYDTVRGGTVLGGFGSNVGGTYSGKGITGFSSSGFTVGTNPTSTYLFNQPGVQNFFWAWKVQERFFDIVQYTGNGSSSRTVSHSLGCLPGHVRVVNSSQDRLQGIYMYDPAASSYYYIQDVTETSTLTPARSPTDANIPVGGSNEFPNSNGVTYTAFLWAHDPDGGLSAATTKIGTGSSLTYNTASLPFQAGAFIQDPLNYYRGTENQSSMSQEGMGLYSFDNFDGLKGILQRSGYATTNGYMTGFVGSSGIGGIGNSWPSTNGPGTRNSFMCWRQGPMSNDGLTSPSTQLFKSQSSSTNGGNFEYDIINKACLVIMKSHSASVEYYGKPNPAFVHIPTGGASLNKRRLPNTYTSNSYSDSTNHRGVGLEPNSISVSAPTGADFGGAHGSSGRTLMAFSWRRWPSVIWTTQYDKNDGTSPPHNFGATPEMIIAWKKLSSSEVSWYTYHKDLGNYTMDPTQQSSKTTTNNPWVSASMSETNLGISSSGPLYQSEWGCIFFGTLAGYSKVGSYTGNGGTQTINAGLSSTCRFALLKSTNGSTSTLLYGGDSNTSSFMSFDGTYRSSVGTSGRFTATSNGFTVSGDQNTNGVEYIYYCNA